MWVQSPRFVKALQVLHSCFSWLRDIQRLSLRGQRRPQFLVQGRLHLGALGAFLRGRDPCEASAGREVLAEGSVDSSSVPEEEPSSTRIGSPGVESNKSKAVAATAGDVEVAKAADGALGGLANNWTTLGTAGA